MRATAALLLILLSTLTYYVPAYIAPLVGFDLALVPGEFYRFYIWFTSATLLLVSVQAWVLFFTIPARYFKAKTGFLWLGCAETYTVIAHVVRKFFLMESHSVGGIVGTLILFAPFFCVVLFVTFYRKKSDAYEAYNTYLARFYPKNFLGVINYIIKQSGHTGIIQNGILYKFDRGKKELVTETVSQEYVSGLVLNNRLVLEKRDRSRKISQLVGTRYKLLTNNCNSLCHVK